MYAVEQERISLQREREKSAATPKQYRSLHRKLDLLRKEVRREFRRINLRLQVILNSLAPFMEIDSDYIISVACQDEADKALLDYLRSKGRVGITPSEACSAKELARFRFKPFQITRRIQRMNRRLKADIGKPLAASYHRRWVLTSFAHKAWGATKIEVENAGSFS